MISMFDVRGLEQDKPWNSALSLTSGLRMISESSCLYKLEREFSGGRAWCIPKWSFLVSFPGIIPSGLSAFVWVLKILHTGHSLPWDLRGQGTDAQDCESHRGSTGIGSRQGPRQPTKTNWATILSESKIKVWDPTEGSRRNSEVNWDWEVQGIISKYTAQRFSHPSLIQ